MATDQGVRPALKYFACPRAKLVSDKKRELRHLVSTMDVDRDGEVLLPRGCQYRTFIEKNPVVFLNHRSHDLVIGNAVEMSASDDGVEALTRFAGLEQHHDEAERVYRLYRDGFMRSWSVGFLPVDRDPTPILPRQRGATIRQWELMEYSAVGIPSNPNAVMRMLKSFGLPSGATERDLAEAVGAIPLRRYWQVAGPVIDKYASAGGSSARHPRAGGDAMKTKRVVRRGRRWCVTTEDGRRTLGCHGSRDDALAQLRAVESHARAARAIVGTRAVVVLDARGRVLTRCEAGDDGHARLRLPPGAAGVVVGDPEALGLSPSLVVPLARRGVRAFTAVAPDGSTMMLLSPATGWPGNVGAAAEAFVDRAAALGQRGVDDGLVELEAADAALLSRAWAGLAEATGGAFAVEKARCEDGDDDDDDDEKAKRPLPAFMMHDEGEEGESDEEEDEGEEDEDEEEEGKAGPPVFEDEEDEDEEDPEHEAGEGDDEEAAERESGEEDEDEEADDDDEESGGKKPPKKGRLPAALAAHQFRPGGRRGGRRRRRPAGARR